MQVGMRVSNQENHNKSETNEKKDATKAFTLKKELSHLRVLENSIKTRIAEHKKGIKQKYTPEVYEKILKRVQSDIRRITKKIAAKESAAA